MFQPVIDKVSVETGFVSPRKKSFEIQSSCPEENGINSSESNLIKEPPAWDDHGNSDIIFRIHQQISTPGNGVPAAFEILRNLPLADNKKTVGENKSNQRIVDKHTLDLNTNEVIFCISNYLK